MNIYNYNLISLIMIYIIRFSNALNQRGIGDNSSWWKSTSEYIPNADSQSYGKLQLRDALYMEFDIIYWGPPPISPQWYNVFRVGFPSDNNNCNGGASRYPSLWIPPGVNQLHFSISQTGNCFMEWPNRPVVTPGTKYHVIIHYNDSHIFISLNDIIYLDQNRIATDTNYIGRDMFVYISTDWQNNNNIDAANVTLSNMIIISYNYSEGYTLPPTSAPTNPPTNNPTKYPSISPTVNIIYVIYIGYIVYK